MNRLIIAILAVLTLVGCTTAPPITPAKYRSYDTPAGVAIKAPPRKVYTCDLPGGGFKITRNKDECSG